MTNVDSLVNGERGASAVGIGGAFILRAVVIERPGIVVARAEITDSFIGMLPSADAVALMPTWVPTEDYLSPVNNGSSVHVAAGWPLLALRYAVRRQELQSGGIVTTLVSVDGLLVPGTTINASTLARSGRALPVLPLWYGLTVNAVMIGITIWLARLAPGWILRRVRVSRGQCPSCGYDLRRSTGRCPECGLVCKSP